MTIVDAIRQSHSDLEVYELLNVYIEAIPFAQNTDGTAFRPTESMTGVMKQTQTLFVALGLVSRRLDDPSRVVIKEALYVFNAALDRLRSLAGVSGEAHSAQEVRRERVESDYFSGHERRRVARDSQCLLA